LTSDLNSFRAALTLRIARLKERLLIAHSDGIGNAYSDEILHSAQLSPVTLTHKLQPQEWERLFSATRDTLKLWMDRLRAEAEAGFPEKVTHFARTWRFMDAMGGMSEVWRKNSTNSLRR